MNLIEYNPESIAKLAQSRGKTTLNNAIKNSHNNQTKTRIMPTIANSSAIKPLNSEQKLQLLSIFERR